MSDSFIAGGIKESLAEGTESALEYGEAFDVNGGRRNSPWQRKRHETQREAARGYVKPVVIHPGRCTELRNVFH